MIVKRIGVSDITNPRGKMHKKQNAKIVYFAAIYIGKKNNLKINGRNIYKMPKVVSRFNAPNSFDGSF